MQILPDKTQIEVKNYTHDILSHTHDHHQLVLPIKGTLEMEVDGVERAVTEATIAVIPSGQFHSCASTGDNSFLIVDIAERKSYDKHPVRSLWGALNGTPFVDVDTSVLGYCNFIAAEMQASTFSQLDKSLTGNLRVRALARSIGINTDVLSPTLIKAVHFIEAQYSNPVTIKDIARAAGISESRLHAQFKSHFALSPKLYMTKLHLKHAASMLENTNSSIAEIALRVGYGDQSAFARAFQRHMGASPAKFRIN